LGARSEADLAAAWFPADGQLQWRAGQEALERREWRQAVCYLSTAQSLLRPSASLLLDLGDALNGSGDAPGAIQRWEAALALNPRSEQALERLRAAYQAQGQWQNLEQVLQTWMALHPQDLSAESQLAEVAAALNPQKAQELLGELGPGGKLPNAELAQLDTTIQNSEKQGGSVYAYARVGEFLLQRGDWALARTALQEAVRENPLYGEAFAYLGYALEQSGQPAEWAYQRAVALSPHDGMTHFLYGSFLARQGEIPQARRELTLSWDLGPKEALMASQLGALEYSAGNLSAAEQWYAEGVKLFPGDEEVWIAQAEFYFGGDLEVMETGIPAARQAAILAPQDPQAIDLLGFGWFLMGDLPTAERLFWRALDQDPTYVPAFLHLGMVAESRNDLRLAVGFYRQAVALDPQGPMAQSAKDRIERIGALR
jgi:tetratricopeptide (TPR) repeat protein